MSQDRTPQPPIMLPMPRDFDLGNLPRRVPSEPIVPPAPNVPDYRVESHSVPCEDRNVINNLLNDRLGSEGRRQLNRTLSQCPRGERIDLDIYNNGVVEVGPSGIGKIRLRGRF